MSALIQVVLPVFIVIAFGYVAAWRGWLKAEAVDALMTFAQGFAIPMLLFRSMMNLDLAGSFDAALWASFYVGALTGFGVGILGARFIFRRTWEEAIAIGFVGLFSNSLLLGLPITERAYGVDALSANFAIIAIHSPFCYAVGITAMEIVKNRGGSIAQLPAKVLRAMFRNMLIIGIICGVIVNLSGFTFPSALTEAIDLMVRAALPTALFGLGGILFRYRPDGDLPTVGFIVTVSLIVHPLVVWGMGKMLGLPLSSFRSAVVTSAMAPGVNAFLFANMYGQARRVAAAAVLLGTAVSIVTASFWLVLLP